MLLLVRFILAGSGDAFTDTRRRKTKHMIYEWVSRMSHFSQDCSVFEDMPWCATKSFGIHRFRPLWFYTLLIFIFAIMNCLLHWRLVISVYISFGFIHALMDIFSIHCSDVHLVSGSGGEHGVVVL